MKSKETIMWEQLINTIIDWDNTQKLQKQGKMIGCTETKSQLIKRLKHKYYLDIMKHENIIEIDTARIPKDLDVNKFMEKLRNAWIEHSRETEVILYETSRPITPEFCTNFLNTL